MEVTERIGRHAISYRAKTPAEILALMQTVDAYRAAKTPPVQHSGFVLGRHGHSIAPTPNTTVSTPTP